MKNTFTLSVLLFPLLAFAQPGTLDNNFDADGIATFDLFGEVDEGKDVAAQPDGKLVFCGTTNDGTGTNGTDMYVARVNPDGSLDNSFGINGVTQIVQSGLDAGNALAIQSDGKILVGGRGDGPNGWDYFIARLNADGSADVNFGSGGILFVEMGPSSDEVVDILVQPDGKIIAVGNTWGNGNYDVGLVRLNPDGSLDNTFSFDGKVITDVLGSDNPRQAVLTADGKITLVGTVSNGDANGMVLRYNSDGTLDATFGTNGQSLLDLAQNGDWLNGLVVLESGSIWVAGAAGDVSTSDVLLARLNSDGSLDNSFSFDGIVQSDLGNAEGGMRVLIQPDDKILVGGSVTESPTTEMALFRYESDGTLDNSFGTGGVVRTAVTDYSFIWALMLQADGKIIAAGNAGSPGTDAALVRYISGINIGIGDIDAYIGSTLIYPNPITDNSITVEYELKSDETVSIDLLDLSGKVIAQLQSEVEQRAGAYQNTLGLPTLTAGNYLLKLITEKGSVAVKLTVN